MNKMKSLPDGNIPALSVTDKGARDTGLVPYFIQVKYISYLIDIF